MGERILRPGIRKSDRTAALVRDGGWIAQVFYDWLLTAVDDFGRFDARPSILRVEIFPLLIDMVRETDVSRCLTACERAGLVRLYQAGGKPYLEVLNFNQRLRAQSSKWPSPPDDVPRPPDDVVTMPTDTSSETETETETGNGATAPASGEESFADITGFVPFRDGWILGGLPPEIGTTPIRRKLIDFFLMLMKKPPPKSWKEQMIWLAEKERESPGAAMQILSDSIRNNYVGLHDKSKSNSPRSKPRSSVAASGREDR